MFTLLFFFYFLQYILKILLNRIYIYNIYIKTFQIWILFVYVSPLFFNQKIAVIEY